MRRRPGRRSWWRSSSSCSRPTSASSPSGRFSTARDRTRASSASCSPRDRSSSCRCSASQSSDSPINSAPPPPRARDGRTSSAPTSPARCSRPARQRPGRRLVAGPARRPAHRPARGRGGPGGVARRGLLPMNMAVVALGASRPSIDKPLFRALRDRLAWPPMHGAAAGGGCARRFPFMEERPMFKHRPLACAAAVVASLALAGPLPRRPESTPARCARPSPSTGSPSTWRRSRRSPTPTSFEGVPTRATGTPGHEASVDYVVDKMQAAGFNVSPAAVRGRHLLRAGRRRVRAGRRRTRSCTRATTARTASGTPPTSRATAT